MFFHNDLSMEDFEEYNSANIEMSDSSVSCEILDKRQRLVCGSLESIENQLHPVSTIALFASGSCDAVIGRDFLVGNAGFVIHIPRLDRYNGQSRAIGGCCGLSMSSPIYFCQPLIVRNEWLTMCIDHFEKQIIPKVLNFNVEVIEIGWYIVLG